MQVMVRARVGQELVEVGLGVAQRADLWTAVADLFGGRGDACVLSVDTPAERLEVEGGPEQHGLKVVCFVDYMGRLSGDHVLATRDQALAASWARVYCPPGQWWLIREVTDVRRGEVRQRVAEPGVH